MDHAALARFVDRRYDEELIPRLVEYVRVPAKSPAFDGDWSAHGHLASVIRSARAWAEAQKIAGMRLEIVSIDGKTPCLFFDVPAARGGRGDAPATSGLGGERTVLFYGHLD